MRQSDRVKALKILRDAVESYGIKELVGDLVPEKAQSTLYAELNEDPKSDATAKLGLFTVLQILQITENPEPFLRWKLGLFGFLPPLAPPRRDVSGESLLEGLGRIAEEMGALAREVRSARDPSGPGGAELMPEETARIVEHARELSGQVQQLAVNAEAATVISIGQRRRKEG